MTDPRVWFLVIGVVLHAAPPAGQNPTFRSGTLEVAVNVSVRSGNNPVSGLTAADFDLFDNGVRQQVRDAAVGAVPVDVTIVLDASGSTERIVGRLQRDAQQMLRSLTAGDRVRLLTIGQFVHEILPMQPAGGADASAQLRGEGLSPVFDAIGVALMRPPEPDRRHVVMAMTDGYDTISSLDAARLRQIAARSEAVLHVLVVSPAQGNPRVPGWLPHQEFDEEALRAAAEATGGQLHDLRPLSSSVRAFRRVLDEFRRSYILRYAPAGVPPEGWHEITVRLKRPGRYSVRARNGYFGIEPRR